MGDLFFNGMYPTSIPVKAAQSMAGLPPPTKFSPRDNDTRLCRDRPARQQSGPHESQGHADNIARSALEKLTCGGKIPPGKPSREKPRRSSDPYGANGSSRRPVRSKSLLTLGVRGRGLVRVQQRLFDY